MLIEAPCEVMAIESKIDLKVSFENAYSEYLSQFIYVSVYP